jgi:phosphoglycerate dehydrogenase-like enzyme
MAHDRGFAETVAMRIVSLSRIWNEDLPPLLDRGLELRGVDPDDEAALAAALPQADILITVEFTKAMGALARRLQLLVCPAAGTEHIDRSALPPGVRLVNGTGHEIPMAEYAIGCLVALRQHLFAADAALRRGKWAFGFWGDAQVNDELAGSALGLVGLGGIGQAIAKRARAFDMRCAAVTLHPDPKRQKEHSLEFFGQIAAGEDVDRLAAWCDALVLCCELSEVTKGLLGERRLGLMKRHALVVNVARGPVADERALYEALRDGRIAGAAIDVWYQYPTKDEMPSAYPFWELRNVIMTPHASAWTDAAKQRRLTEIARVINEFWRASARV